LHEWASDSACCKLGGATLFNGTAAVIYYSTTRGRNRAVSQRPTWLPGRYRDTRACLVTLRRRPIPRRTDRDTCRSVSGANPRGGAVHPWRSPLARERLSHPGGSGGGRASCRARYRAAHFPRTATLPPILRETAAPEETLAAPDWGLFCVALCALQSARERRRKDRIGQDRPGWSWTPLTNANLPFRRH